MSRDLGATFEMLRAKALSVGVGSFDSEPLLIGRAFEYSRVGTPSDPEDTSAAGALVAAADAFASSIFHVGGRDFQFWTERPETPGLSLLSVI
jgi:hypothetical protein